MTDFTKGMTVYFRGNPVKKQWFMGKLECMVHPRSGNQFDLVADWAPEFNETYAVVTPTAETHERLPWAPAESGTFFPPQLMEMSRLSVEDPSVKTRAKRYENS